jgi:hypothetical protein
LRAALERPLNDSLWSLRSSLWTSLTAALANSRVSAQDSLRAGQWQPPEALNWALCSEDFIDSIALADLGARIGVEFDRQNYDLLKNYCENVGWIFPFQNICIVCDRPAVKWRNGVIHSDDSPAVEFKDGFKIWAIGGVTVTEQIVMSRTTETIEQINSEENRSW